MPIKKKKKSKTNPAPQSQELVDCPHPECDGQIEAYEDDTREFQRCNKCGYIDSSTVADKK